MAKTGYVKSFVFRKYGTDLSELEKIHQEVFPNNKLAVWGDEKGILVKVSHYNKISEATAVTSLESAKDSVDITRKVTIYGK